MLIVSCTPTIRSSLDIFLWCAFYVQFNTFKNNCGIYFHCFSFYNSLIMKCISIINLISLLKVKKTNFLDDFLKFLSFFLWLAYLTKFLWLSFICKSLYLSCKACFGGIRFFRYIEVFITSLRQNDRAVEWEICDLEPGLCDANTGVLNCLTFKMSPLP